MKFNLFTCWTSLTFSESLFISKWAEMKLSVLLSENLPKRSFYSCFVAEKAYALQTLMSGKKTLTLLKTALLNLWLRNVKLPSLICRKLPNIWSLYSGGRPYKLTCPPNKSAVILTPYCIVFMLLIPNCIIILIVCILTKFWIGLNLNLPIKDTTLPLLGFCRQFCLNIVSPTECFVGKTVKCFKAVIF